MASAKDSGSDPERASGEKATELTRLLAQPSESALAPESTGQLDALVKNFGSRLLIILFAGQHLIKGFARSLTIVPQRYMFKAYAVAAPTMQVYMAVTQLPWAMKPLVGLVSDLVPIYGFHKQPYLTFSVLVGCAACAVVGFLPQEQLSITQLVLCFFLMSVMFSVVDLLTEAKYAERMRFKSEYGPALLSYVWGGITLAGLVAVALTGPLLQVGVKVPFICALLPICIFFWPLLQNYLDETVRTAEEVAATRASIFGQVEVCYLSLVLFAGTCSLTFLGVWFEDIALNAAAALVVGLVVLLSFTVALRPIVAKVNAFAVLQTSLNFSIQGASFYFYTNGPEEYPEGPHFSDTFYTSVLGVISASFTLLGVISYNRFASDWTYRRLFIVTNLAVSVLNLADVAIFSRANVALGIPDEVFVVGAEVFHATIDAWQWMPMVVILAQLCPAGMEATMYALLAGCHNLGSAIAANFGAYVLVLLNCEPQGEPNESAQFENLWLASLLSTVLPLIAVALIPWLIPDAKQKDRLYAEGDASATAGSLLRGWIQAIDEVEVVR